MDTQDLQAIIALVTLAPVIALEHNLFGQWWKRYELARRGMGIGTVLAWLGVLAYFGGIDGRTWLVFVLGFGVAAGVLVLMRTNESAKTNEHAHDELCDG